MSDRLAVGPEFTRPAWRMQPTKRIARRFIAAASAADGTDGLMGTDRRTWHRFNTLRGPTAYAVSVK